MSNSIKEKREKKQFYEKIRQLAKTGQFEEIERQIQENGPEKQLQKARGDIFKDPAKNKERIYNPQTAFALKQQEVHTATEQELENLRKIVKRQIGTYDIAYGIGILGVAAAITAICKATTNPPEEIMEKLKIISRIGNGIGISGLTIGTAFGLTRFGKTEKNIDATRAYDDYLTDLVENNKEIGFEQELTANFLNNMKEETKPLTLRRQEKKIEKQTKKAA